MISVVPGNRQPLDKKTEITITDQLEGIGTRSFVPENFGNIRTGSKDAKKGRKLTPENSFNYPIITTKLNDPIPSQDIPGNKNSVIKKKMHYQCF